MATDAIQCSRHVRFINLWLHYMRSGGAVCAANVKEDPRDSRLVSAVVIQIVNGTTIRFQRAFSRKIN